MVQNKDVGTASYDGFSCQLLFHRKEEFAGNALQAGGSSATATFAPDKTKAGAAGMKPENNQVKRIE